MARQQIPKPSGCVGRRRQPRRPPRPPRRGSGGPGPPARPRSRQIKPGRWVQSGSSGSEYLDTSTTVFPCPGPCGRAACYSPPGAGHVGDDPAAASQATLDQVPHVSVHGPRVTAVQMRTYLISASDAYSIRTCSPFPFARPAAPGSCREPSRVSLAPPPSNSSGRTIPLSNRLTRTWQWNSESRQPRGRHAAAQLFGGAFDTPAKRQRLPYGQAACRSGNKEAPPGHRAE
jgi:hypothetical protein